MSPAALARRLREQIKAERLDVELTLDHRWIFLRHAGFSFRDFGDVTARERALGKWWRTCPQNTLIETAAQLLSGLHYGPLKLAKFTNIANWPNTKALIAVYAMDADPNIHDHLTELGWTTAWRSNRETYQAM